jgi:hypothetical protein
MRELFAPVRVKCRPIIPWKSSYQPRIYSSLRTLAEHNARGNYIFWASMKKSPKPGPYASQLQTIGSSWVPEYDVRTRMEELENFWKAGVTPALYDALKHMRAHPSVKVPA